MKKRPATLPVPGGCIEEQLEHVASKHGFVLSQKCLRETKRKDLIQRGKRILEVTERNKAIVQLTERLANIKGARILQKLYEHGASKEDLALVKSNGDLPECCLAD